MLSPLSVLPLQLACQLLTEQNFSSVNVSFATPSSKLAMELPDGYTVFPRFGVAYKFYATQVSWHAARKYCAAHGANLAVMDSYEKIEAFRRIKTGGAHVHVGIHRLFDSNEWTDVKNGLPVEGVPWRTGSGVDDKSQQGVAVHVSENALFAIGTNSLQSFVCEIALTSDLKMPHGELVTLPLHFACQLITPENPEFGNVTIVADTPLPNYTTVLPDGYTAFPDVGRAYKYYANKLTWNAARKQCIAEGASLAIVDSFKKIQYIMGLKEKTQGVHTGIHRLFDGVEWSGIKSGQTTGFIPWKPDAEIKSEIGKCVAMWFDGNGVGPWSCDHVLPAICEIPIFKDQKSGLQSSERLRNSIVLD